MADIIIGQKKYSGVERVRFPSQHGGEARFWAMDGPLAWLGPDAEFLGRIYEEAFTLAETGFPDWTPSTTQTSVRASKNAAVFEADLERWEYSPIWRGRIDCAYVQGYTKTACLVRAAGVWLGGVYRRPNSGDDIAAMEDGYNAASAGTSTTGCAYYNTSGKLTYATTVSYGIYLTSAAAVFSNTSSLTPTVTAKTPTLYCRGSNTYMATARFAELDAEHTTIRLACDLYRGIRGSLQVGHVFRDALRLMNDGENV